MDVFKDVVPSILQTKKDCMEGDVFEGEYNAFITNKALSFHKDCLMYANMMNLHPGLDKKLQFHYLLNSIRGYKRPFQKWPKKNTIENIELVKEYYNYSDNKALDSLKILSENHLEKMKKLMDKGGLNTK